MYIAVKERSMDESKMVLSYIEWWISKTPCALTSWIVIENIIDKIQVLQYLSSSGLPVLKFS